MDGRFTMKLIMVICLSCGLAFAQEKPQPKESVAPVVTDKHQKEFFKQQAIALQSEVALNSANAELRAAYEAMKKDCGDGYNLQFTKQNDAFCVANTETKK